MSLYTPILVLAAIAAAFAVVSVVVAVVVGPRRYNRAKLEAHRPTKAEEAAEDELRDAYIKRVFSTFTRNI